MSSTLYIFVLIFIGCLASCSVNILLTTFLYGKKIFEIKNDIDKYNGDVSINDITKITTGAIARWNILPAFLNVIIWGGIIFYIRWKIISRDSICG